MHRRLTSTACAVAAVTAAALAACASPPDAPLRVAPALTSQRVCSGTFVSGLPPDTVLDERVLGLPGMGWTRPLLSVDVDRSAGRVTTRMLGGHARAAVYRDGCGCVLLPDGGAAPAFVPDGPVAFASPWPGLDVPGPVEPPPGPLRDAVDRAFADASKAPFHRTRALVVVQGDRIVAERYADGHGVDTPLPSWSTATSITHALVGTHAPPDTFFARRFMGQYVVVVPSRDLVVVRLGASQVEGDDVRFMDRVLGRLLAALDPPPLLAAR